MLQEITRVVGLEPLQEVRLPSSPFCHALTRTFDQRRMHVARGWPIPLRPGYPPPAHATPISRVGQILSSLNIVINNTGDQGVDPRQEI